MPAIIPASGTDIPAVCGSEVDGISVVDGFVPIVPVDSVTEYRSWVMNPFVS